MQLTTPDIVNEGGDERVFRASPVPALLGFLVFAVPLVVVPPLILGGGKPGPLWIVVGPMILVGGLVWCLALWALAGASWSTLRPTNWRMRVAPAAGVALNLRSHLNGHFEGTDPTVVLLDFGEILSARKVRERSVFRTQRSTTYRYRWFLELVLESDTEDLATAIEIERTRKGPTYCWLGIRTRSKFYDVPVQVVAPGVVWVTWSRGMLAALQPFTRVRELHKLEVDLRQGTLEERMRGLVERGERMAAIELAREELDLDLTEALRRLDRGLGKPAA